MNRALLIFLFFAGLIAMVTSQGAAPAAGGATPPAGGAAGGAAGKGAGAGGAAAGGAGAAAPAAGGATPPAGGAAGAGGATPPAGGAAGGATPPATGAAGGAGGAGMGAVMINVGANGALSFDPQVANVMPGQMVTWTWVSGKHSIIQSDSNGACTPSTMVNPALINTNGPLVAPNTYSITVPATATGKMWYYCGVPGHCAAGMYGTLVVGAGGNSSMPSNTTSGSMPATSGKANAASRFSSSTALSAGAVLMAAALLS